MKRLFNDDITKSIAATVQNVLEGKPAVKKEAEEFKPHMMYDPKTGKGYKAEKPEDHERMAKLGYVHEKPKNVSEVEEPNKPTKHANMGSKQGEDEFKKMHKGKKVGENEDGKVVKEYTINVPLNEETIDVDYIGGRDLSKKLEKKFKVKIKDTGSTTADITGTKANLIKLLKSDAYLMDEDEIEDTFPELYEAVDEESAKQAAYKKVFDAALKKFGVSGIGELDAEKKKEFFNYVDKNYEAKAENLDNEDDEDVDEITSKQSKKLPPALVKAIKKKEKEEVKEGKLSVKAFTGPEGGGPSHKRFGLKLKKLGSSQYGGDDVELSGPDSSLLKFAKAALGVVKAKNLKDAQKEIDDVGP
jgi:hypothetical protein|tara:strand:+ start:21 stop:1097 length:1077 start_codon:yes stop_codon:yes gene_type:complete